MHLWLHSCKTPEENLATDEALFLHVEQSGESWLRIWEPRKPSVVLGFSNRIHREANLSFCHENEIPILRRISGGGAVTLDPGCLCYSLAVPISDSVPFTDLTSTNRFIMEQHRSLLEQLLNQTVCCEGITDLSVDGRKCSGNSQKRGRNSLLFHGTFLLKADLRLISESLQHPSREPGWRQGRNHDAFVGNLDLDRTALIEALTRVWRAEPGSSPDIGAQSVANLVQDKYRRKDWNYRI